MEPIDKSSNFTFTPSALFYIFEGRSTLCSSTVRFLTRLYPRRVFNILNSIDRYSRKKERVFGDFLSSERVLSFFIASVVARRCAIVDEINKTLDNRDPPPPPIEASPCRRFDDQSSIQSLNTFITRFFEF